MPNTLLTTTPSFLRTLCNLRWVAIVGQAVTVLVALGLLDIDLPRWPLWAGIGALALFNVYAFNSGVEKWKKDSTGTNSEASKAAETKIVFMVGSFRVFEWVTETRDGGSKSVSAGVFGVFYIKVFVGVAVIGGGETEAVGRHVVLVAV